MGISASPTIRINQEPYTNTIEATPVLYEICQSMENPMSECSKVAMCSQDAHCNKKGKKTVFVRIQNSAGCLRIQGSGKSESSSHKR